MASKVSMVGVMVHLIGSMVRIVGAARCGALARKV